MEALKILTCEMTVDLNQTEIVASSKAADDEFILNGMTNGNDQQSNIN